MKIKIVLALVFIVSVFSYCHKNAITGKRSLNLIPESEIMTMSCTEYDKFLSEHKPLPDFNQDVILVRKVGEKIQRAVEKYYADNGLSSQLSGFKWEFNVVDDQTVNAWCMPGGKLVVYSGLLPVTKDETGLAFVMGHEIAHAVARHGNERMSQLLLAETGSIALDVALANKPDQTRALFGTAYGAGTQLGVLLPFSRLHETEADELGMIFMAMAGYDPRKAPEVWQRMIQIKTGPKPPEFLSTHPADNNRIEALKKFIPEALKYYKPRQ
jgi:predicted Zn-dependent protease